MTNRTILQVVDMVYVSATALGLDISPEDTAFIISSFLQGIADAKPASPADKWLLEIAEEANKTKNED